MNTADFLGKYLDVKIDRPLGSKHPKHSFIYPVNYGFVPNTLSADGEELDCYVLGIHEPINSFYGKCIASMSDADQCISNACGLWISGLQSLYQGK